MKNIFTVSLWIVSIFLALLLCISFALTQKKFNSFLLKSYLDSEPTFNIEESNWHPVKPSILMGSLESKAQSQVIFADEILIEFSLISIFRGKFISRLSINDITIQSQNIEKDTDLFSLFGSFKTIEELNIPKDQKDLLKFKKALYLIKNSEKEKGDALLKNLMESESKFQKLVEDVIIK